MKRIGVVGAGGWSTRMHQPALKRLQGEGCVDYAAVCDLDADKAKAYAAELDAAVFTDLDQMVSECQPDALVIIAPVSITPKLIQAAAERGLPFLTEKPPATDLATHQRLIDVVGDSPHVVAYNRRHAPYITRAQEWMRDAEIQAVSCDFLRCNRRDPDFTSTSIHGVDASLCLTGQAFANVRIESTPYKGIFNQHLTGWTTGGIHVSIRIQPATGRSEEHYLISSTERVVRLAFPQPNVIDEPGYVELNVKNEVADRKTAADLGIADDDHPMLCGIYHEHLSLIELVEGRAKAVSTLATSLQPQCIREAMRALIEKGRRRATEIDFSSMPRTS